MSLAGEDPTLGPGLRVALNERLAVRTLRSVDDQPTVAARRTPLASKPVEIPLRKHGYLPHLLLCVSQPQPDVAPRFQSVTADAPGTPLPLPPLPDGIPIRSL